MAIIDFAVVLVEPKYEGNVGAIARSMKNFGLKKLVLVNPCEIGDVGEKRAMHAIDVLKNARVAENLEDALEGMDFIAATSGVETASEKKFNRIALTPRQFAEKTKEMAGTVALVFGREDFGLLNEEVRRADFLITIPTSEEYPIMNLSHSAAVIFYELSSRFGEEKPGVREADNLEKEKMHEHFSKLLEAIDYPEFKREKVEVMFRRLMGRATPSKWEFHTLMGVLSKAIKESEK